MTGNRAGQSADGVARRTREKIERLERAAAAWDAGAAGERATGRVLAQLDPAHWRVLHDVPWPGRARANIDHVVIGPPGVFVIDSKNWSGSVTVADNVLRQNGRSREKAVAGAAEAGIAVLELVPDVPVHPVLCLARDEPFEGWVRDVMLCSTVNLLRMLTTRPAALDPGARSRATAAIEVGLRRTTRTPGTRRTAAPRSPVPSRRASRGRQPSGVRVLVGLLLMVLLIGGMQTGLYFDAFSKLGELVGSQFVDNETPADAPARP